MQPSVFIFLALLEFFLLLLFSLLFLFLWLLFLLSSFSCSIFKHSALVSNLALGLHRCVVTTCGAWSTNTVTKLLLPVPPLCSTIRATILWFSPICELLLTTSGIFYTLTRLDFADLSSILSTKTASGLGGVVCDENTCGFCSLQIRWLYKFWVIPFEPMGVNWFYPSSNLVASFFWNFFSIINRFRALSGRVFTTLPDSNGLNSLVVNWVHPTCLETHHQIWWVNCSITMPVKQLVEVMILPDMKS